MIHSEAGFHLSVLFSWYDTQISMGARIWVSQRCAFSWFSITSLIFTTGLQWLPDHDQGMLLHPVFPVPFMRHLGRQPQHVLITKYPDALADTLHVDGVILEPPKQ